MILLDNFKFCDIFKVRIMRIFITILIILSMTFVTACRHVDTLAQTAANAELIDRGTANFISISARAFESAAEQVTPEQEYYIGRAVAANILSTYRIYNGDRALTNYLNLICQAIVLNSPQPVIFNNYNVTILDSSEINAFATSGGHIFVTRGLLNVVKSEDALASVIAHEVAHIQLRHGIKAIKTSRATQALLVTAAAGIGNAMGMDVNELTDIMNESVSEIMQAMVNSGYSKEMEYEADIAAMYLLAAAGYEPSSLLEMLAELAKVHVVSTGFGRTHPAPGQRIFYAQRALGRFDVADTKSERQKRFGEALRMSLAGR